MSALRNAAYERAGGLSEVSGLPLPPDGFELHHRRNKGMGGTSRTDTDTLPNVLVMLPREHNMHLDSVHDRPTWARSCGYLLGKDVARPAAWPVLLAGARWVLLGDDGLYHPLPG